MSKLRQPPGVDYLTLLGSGLRPGRPTAQALEATGASAGAPQERDVGPGRCG